MIVHCTAGREACVEDKEACVEDKEACVEDKEACVEEGTCMEGNRLPLQSLEG